MSPARVKLPPIIGSHPAIVRIRRQLPGLAARHERLIISGEPGVGKTLIAEHMHALGPLKSFPMRRVNLLLLNDRDRRVELLGGESPELSTTRRSVLELRTTVVIKNVDAANGYLQDTLASMLISGDRSGAKDAEGPAMKCRLYLLLRASPLELHRTGALSASLFAAIKGIRRIHVPPLRSRPGDIPALVAHYTGIRLSGQALKLVQHMPWDGNICTLKAYLRLLVAYSPEGAVFEHEKMALEKAIMMVEEGREFSLSKSVEFIVRRIVSRAVRGSNGVQANAARLLGLSERSVRRQMQNSGNSC